MINKIVETFDIALKTLHGGNVDEGYTFSDGRIYKAYFTREQWEDYYKSMKVNHPQAFNEFKEGDGDELSEWFSESGKLLPPKMASYASSSRFIFEASKFMQDDFHFECKLPIAFQGFKKEAEASLDGFISSERFFVEAKCHEIYYGSEAVYKHQYKGFYNFLRKETKGRLDYKVTTNDETENIHFIWDGKNVTTFDLKQLLCHMLGIAKKALLEDCSQTSTLLYLVYKPENSLFDLIKDDSIKNSITTIWNCERKEAELIDIKLLYRLIVQYLFKYKNHEPWINDGPYSNRVENISNAFEFRFCDQHEYQNILRTLKNSDVVD